jgi:hypothetical protein
VVNYHVPDSLESWLQRAGRAGRSTKKQAEAILMVERSVFSKRNAGRPNPETGEVEYVKKVEPALRKYITAHERGECRRAVVDHYFDNPPEAGTSGERRFNTYIRSDIGELGIVEPKIRCQACDVCISLSQKEAQMKKRDELPDPDAPSIHFAWDLSLDQFGTLDLNHDNKGRNTSPHRTLNKETRTPVVALEGPTLQPTPTVEDSEPTTNHPTRKDAEHVMEIMKALEGWRVSCWMRRFSDQPWGPEALIPDEILEKIAKRRCPSREALGQYPFSWALVAEFGDEVQLIVEELDHTYDSIAEEKAHQEEVENRRKKEEVRLAREQRREAEKAAKRQAKEEEAFARKRVREQEVLAKKRAKEEEAEAKRHAKQQEAAARRLAKEEAAEARRLAKQQAKEEAVTRRRLVKELRMAEKIAQDAEKENQKVGTKREGEASDMEKQQPRKRQKIGERYGNLFYAV